MKKRTIRREKKVYSKSDRAITLIALIVTIIVNRVFYDKNKNISNLVGSSLWFIYTYNKIVIEKDNNSIFLVKNKKGRIKKWKIKN